MDIEELKKEYEERFTDSLPIDKFNEWFDPLLQHHVAVNIWIWLEGKLKSTQIGKANQVDADVMCECDCCGQMFPESYFCKKCSNKYLGTEDEEAPNIMWEGCNGNEMEWEKIDQYSGDVCGNCCTCHLRQST